MPKSAPIPLLFLNSKVKSLGDSEMVPCVFSKNWVLVFLSHKFKGLNTPDDKSD